ncbi:MAG: F0F1 ATP synthase subunit A [Pseudomonadota bacterium]
MASEETAAHGGGEIEGHAPGEEHSPLEQFEIHPLITDAPNFTLFGFDLSFTNSSLWMVITIICVYTLVMLGSRQSSMVPGRLQALVEMIYDFIAGLIESNAGREGRKYFPFFFTLFTFILTGNMLGMIPGSFTFTSHIIVTFTMAMFVVVSVTVIALRKHGLHFFSFFVPKGVPGPVLPLLVPIEVLSYLIRPISLSVRLFVNMMAGHIMLKTFAGFIIALSGYFVIPALAPLALTVALSGLEFAIAFLQAYVFTVLSCIYLQEALHLH